MTTKPITCKESVTFNFCDITKVAAGHVWGSLTSPKSNVVKVIKVTLGVPAYLVLTATAVVVAAIVVFAHLLALTWMARKSWGCHGFGKYVETAFKEALTVLFAVALYPVDLTRLNPTFPAGTKAEKTPILLVHGFLHNSSAWFYLLEKLQQATGAPIYTINLGGVCNSIMQHAELIQQKIKEIAAATGRDDIFIVGHSMGGDAASYYATALAPPNTVKSVVTAGSPIGGTITAQIIPLLAAREMTYQSPFAQDLTKSITGTAFTHMGSTTDIVVQPIESVLPKNSSGTLIEFDNAGHMTMLLSESVKDRIVEAYTASTSVLQSERPADSIPV